MRFKVLKLIENLLRTALHGFKIIPINDEVLKNLKTEIGNFEAIVIDPENYIYEEINEHQRQVDLDRERLKIKIDDSASDLVQELESYRRHKVFYQFSFFDF